MTDEIVIDYDVLKAQFEEATQHLHSIRDYIRFGVSKINEYELTVAHGTTDPYAESAAMVLSVLSLGIEAHPEILPCKLTPQEKTAVLDLLYRRIVERVPLSYLLNVAYFCKMPFYVDERVLIPRSPIARLIETRFYPYFDDGEHQEGDFGLPERGFSPPERILDLCTGSGCIAIALADTYPLAQVDATDIDEDALTVAAYNREAHQMEGRVNLFKSDLFDNLPKGTLYDLIVTNPPYVDAAEMAELAPEFMHEPDLALAGGQDGLLLVHKILADAPDYLADHGLLVCEVGNSQWALTQTYPQIEFNWLELDIGTNGVFAICKADLLLHQEAFRRYAHAFAT